MSKIVPLMYTVQDVLTITGLSDSTIRRMIIAKIIPTFRVGTRVLISKEALEQFVTECQEGKYEDFWWKYQQKAAG